MRSREELINVARKMGPFEVDRAGYVWGNSAKGGKTVIANVRGWGYLTGHGSGALGMKEDDAIAEQERWGEMFVAALNAFAAQSTVTTEEERLRAAEDLADAQFAANVRAVHIEKLEAELRHTKRMLWAAVRAAGGKVEIYGTILIDAPDGVLEARRNDERDSTVLEARLERSAKP